MKIPNTKPSGHAERAQSLVEFAISLIVILMLLAGAANFGMAFFSYVALRDAAQEAAMYGSIDPTSINDIRDRARYASTNPVPLSDPTKVTVTPVILGSPCQGTPSGGTPNAIRVTVDYDFPLVMPLAGTVFGRQTIPLSATATYSILAPVCTN